MIGYWACIITPQCMLFLSPVSWEWDTNVTTFSVVFVHKLLYNAGKNSVKVKEKKTD